MNRMTTKANKQTTAPTKRKENEQIVSTRRSNNHVYLYRYIKGEQQQKPWCVPDESDGHYSTSTCVDTCV